LYPEIPITLAMFQSAYGKTIELDKKLKRSFNDRCFGGMLGEEVYQYIAPHAQRANTYDYDFILREKKIDVKTRHFNTYPRPNYSISLMYPRENQDVDFYVFMGIRGQATLAYALGYLSKEEMFRVGERKGKDEPFPQGRGYYTEDSIVVQLEQLHPIPKDLLRDISNGDRRPVSATL
jgi:hypothetical protein